jgi:hypothetical protein
MLDNFAPAAFLLAFVGLCAWTYYHFHHQRHGLLWLFLLVLPYAILSIGIADYCFTSQWGSALIYGVTAASLIGVLQFMSWQEGRRPALPNADGDDTDPYP